MTFTGSSSSAPVFQDSLRPAGRTHMGLIPGAFLDLKSECDRRRSDVTSSRGFRMLQVFDLVCPCVEHTEAGGNRKSANSMCLSIIVTQWVSCCCAASSTL